VIASVRHTARRRAKHGTRLEALPRLNLELQAVSSPAVEKELDSFNHFAVVAFGRPAPAREPREF
jgi:hypothetical protein